VIISITLRAARAGVVTGVLLALARISGETARCSLRRCRTNFSRWIWPHRWRVCRKRFSLFAMSPFQNWQELACGRRVPDHVSALLLLNILARVLFRKRD